MQQKLMHAQNSSHKDRERNRLNRATIASSLENNNSISNSKSNNNNSNNNSSLHRFSVESLTGISSSSSKRSEQCNTSNNSNYNETIKNEPLDCGVSTDDDGDSLGSDFDGDSKIDDGDELDVEDDASTSSESSKTPLIKNRHHKDKNSLINCCFSN